jgi:ABC-type nitrate/sulfonate/bicarbonate transport system substrate-binding protein
MLGNGTARSVANPAEDSPYIQGGGVTVIFTSAEFAKTYPNVTRKYIEIQENTQTWILANQDEAGAILQRVTRVPTEMSKIIWSRRAANWAYSEKNLNLILRETQVTVDWLESHGEVKKGAINVANLFDTQFFDK